MADSVSASNSNSNIFGDTGSSSFQTRVEVDNLVNSELSDSGLGGVLPTNQAFSGSSNPFDSGFDPYSSSASGNVGGNNSSSSDSTNNQSAAAGASQVFSALGSNNPFSGAATSNNGGFSGAVDSSNSPYGGNPFANFGNPNAPGNPFTGGTNPWSQIPSGGNNTSTGNSNSNNSQIGGSTNPTTNQVDSNVKDLTVTVTNELTNNPSSADQVAPQITNTVNSLNTNSSAFADTANKYADISNQFAKSTQDGVQSLISNGVIPSGGSSNSADNSNQPGVSTDVANWINTNSSSFAGIVSKYADITDQFAKSPEEGVKSLISDGVIPSSDNQSGASADTLNTANTNSSAYTDLVNNYAGIADQFAKSPQDGIESLISNGIIPSGGSNNSADGSQSGLSTDAVNFIETNSSAFADVINKYIGIGNQFAKSPEDGVTSLIADGVIPSGVSSNPFVGSSSSNSFA